MRVSRLSNWRTASGGLAALVLLASCGGGPPAGFPAGAAVPVTVVTLKAEPVTLTRELPGRTSAFRVADVRPQANGVVRERLFTEGGVVKAGQTLYQLDDALYRAQYDSSVAVLARAQATLTSARLAARRAEELAKIDAVSAQDNEAAAAALGQAEADVGAARAAVESARVNLDYTRLPAPIGGRIGKSAVTAGALVVANQAAVLATVQQLDPLYVEVSQSSSEWLRLRHEVDAGRMSSGPAGARVTILLEDGTRYPHDGRLQFTDVTVDPATGSFLLRIIVPNPDTRLLPGMFVRAVVDEGVLPAGLLAPQQGIARDPKGNATALVVGADGKAELRTVTVSRTYQDAWVVDSGLKAGDKLIVEGLQKLQPGAPVLATERGAAAPAPPATAGRH